MSAGLDSQPSNISRLIAALADDDGLTRQHAREALVDIGRPAASALAVELSSPHEQVRWEAAKALHDIADPESAPALVLALEDREFSVRWLAAEGLAAIGQRSLPPLLEALVERGDHQWLRRGAHHALKALSKRGLPEPVTLVLDALESVEPELVVPPAAQTALKALRDQHR